ncbi:hypothetical protein EGW08_008249, partial [Elysia chlorotica]
EEASSVLEPGTTWVQYLDSQPESSPHPSHNLLEEGPVAGDNEDRDTEYSDPVADDTNHPVTRTSPIDSPDIQRPRTLNQTENLNAHQVVTQETSEWNSSQTSTSVTSIPLESQQLLRRRTFDQTETTNTYDDLFSGISSSTLSTSVESQQITRQRTVDQIESQNTYEGLSSGISSSILVAHIGEQLNFLPLSTVEVVETNEGEEESSTNRYRLSGRDLARQAANDGAFSMSNVVRSMLEDGSIQL